MIENEKLLEVKLEVAQAENEKSIARALRAEKVIPHVMGIMDYLREQLTEAKKELREELAMAKKEAGQTVDYLYGLHMSTCSLGLSGKCPFCIAASSFLSESLEAREKEAVD